MKAGDPKGLSLADCHLPFEGCRTAPEVARLAPDLGRLGSFGEDDAGELYVVTSGGAILRVAATDGAE